MTLEPGDVILTGTPANSRPVQPGDVVTVEVDGLGVLENHIVEGASGISDECGSPPTDTDVVRGVALGEGLKE
jgi:5-oxopent-3-ene-1,2,5-tricarboxylate decarboxylase/2-hydroxyhepta-2,4-diene-1,7-dioate isomerase